MKKQFLFIAAIIAAALFSCTKEKIETPPAANESFESISKPVIQIDPLSIDLDGWFKFNGNLKEASGKLPDGIQSPLKRTGVVYTTDRKGVANAALKLDGSYWVDFSQVTQQMNSSLSIWIKRTMLFPDATIISPNGWGERIDQDNYVFRGLVQNGWILPEVYSASFTDPSWYHVVVTFDGTTMKLYVNGKLQGSNTPPQHSYPNDKIHYLLGATFSGYWQGAIDDLRFYKRTLTDSDVTALYNQ